MNDITWEAIEHTQVISCPEHGNRNCVAVCSVCAGLVRNMPAMLKQMEKNFELDRQMREHFKEALQEIAGKRDAGVARRIALAALQWGEDFRNESLAFAELTLLEGEREDPVSDALL